MAGRDVDLRSLGAALGGPTVIALIGGFDGVVGMAPKTRLGAGVIVALGTAAGLWRVIGGAAHGKIRPRCG